MRTYLLLAGLLLISPALAQDAATFAKQLGDADAAKREAAAGGLAELGPEALPALEQLLAATQDKAYKVRVASIRALVAIGPKGSAASHKPLLVLLHDKSAQVREEAAKALPPLGLASKSLPQLAGLFGDQKWRVRAAAVEAVGSTGAAAEPLSEELRSLSTGDASASVRKLAAAASKKLEAALGGGSASDPQSAPLSEPQWRGLRLSELLADLSKDAKSMRNACKGIRWLGPVAASALPHLLAVLEDESKRALHDECMDTIGYLGEAAAPAIPALITRLKVKREYDRMTPAQALGKIGPKAKVAVPALIEAWDASPAAFVRARLAQGFAGIGPASAPALERLIEAISEASKSEQSEIAAAIAVLGPAGAEFLLQRAGDSKLSTDARSRALLAATSCRGAEERVVKAAWDALDSTTEEDWERGSEALKKLAMRSPLPLQAISALEEHIHKDPSQQRTKFLKALVKQLRFAQPFHALVKHDPATPAAIPALLERLDADDYRARDWLRAQARMNTKVVEALGAHVGQKTEGPAYKLLCQLAGQLATAPSPPNGGASKEASPEANKATSAPDLSHVKVGQVYVYEIEAGGTKMQMNFVVEKVDATSVRYSTETVVAGRTTKSPSTIWRFVDPKDAKAKPPANAAETRFEAFEFQGESWETMVVESNGSTTWILLKGGAPTFPPFVKTDGASKMTLVKIEQP